MNDVALTEVLRLDGPAGRLSACLRAPERPSLRAVVAHPHPLYGGTMENAVVRSVAGRLLAAGAAVLTFDFRGVRESAGSFDDGAGEQLDLLAAERERERRFPRLPHWLAGYSFGANVTLARIERRQAPAVDALLVIAPPLAHRHVPTPGSGAPPLALVTGELDPLTPGALVRGFASSLPHLARHEIVAAAGHDLGTAGPPGVEALVGALDRSIESLLSLRDRSASGPSPAAGGAGP